MPDLDTTFHNCYIRIGEYPSGRVVETNDAPFSIVDVSAIAEINRTPGEFVISAFPNPFNSAVNIRVRGVEDSRVRVEIFDIAGWMVAELRQNRSLSGAETTFAENSLRLRSGSELCEYIWQPDESIGSGIYLIRASVGSETSTKRVVYLK